MVSAVMLSPGEGGVLSKRAAVVWSCQHRNDNDTSPVLERLLSSLMHTSKFRKTILPTVDITLTKGGETSTQRL